MSEPRVLPVGGDDLEFDPIDRSADRSRRIRIFRTTTLALCSIAAVAVLQYWLLGLPGISLAALLTIAAGLANLLLLKWTQRPVLCGHIGLAILTSLLIVSNVTSGGFHDPNFAWFYVLPLGAAIITDLRGAAAWLGVTLAVTLVFWLIEVAGTPLPNQIPPDMRNAQALFNRVTAILALCFVSSSFVFGQRRAERRLARSNARLRKESAYVQLLEHAAVAANEASSLEQAMQEGVKRICTAMAWPVGHIYLADDQRTLRTGRVFHEDDPDDYSELREKTLETTFAPGVGLPGRALKTRRAQAYYDLPAQSDRPRTALARKLGLHTAFAIPVLVHGRAIAVLEFGARERLSPNDRLLEVLAHVGVQIGRVGERAALEQRLRQSQKLEAVGRLAAGVAHEINNPMAYVRSNLNHLRSGWRDLRTDVEKADSLQFLAERFDECEDLIDESLEGVERTVSIVRDMKELSHVGANAREPANLREIADSAVRVASSRAPVGVQVECSNHEDLGAVTCAAHQIHQVLVNLVVNAIEAVGSDGRVVVTTLREDDLAVVRVEDDGPGMTEDTREHLFDPFFTTKAAGEGTGLGLAISYEIARSHGGEIRVRSAPGFGSVMEVALPLNSGNVEA
ncbi:MAG: sensor histidine kinase [Myxococcota bacterium]